MTGRPQFESVTVDILRFVELLWRPGDVREVRIPKYNKYGHTASGYFDSPESLAESAAKWDGKAEPGHLFSEYQRWSKEQGILERHRLGSRSFGTRIRERFGDSVSSNGKRYFLGIGLKANQ